MAKVLVRVDGDALYPKFYNGGSPSLFIMLR